MLWQYHARIYTNSKEAMRTFYWFINNIYIYIKSKLNSQDPRVFLSFYFYKNWDERKKKRRIRALYIFF